MNVVENGSEAAHVATVDQRTRDFVPWMIAQSRKFSKKKKASEVEKGKKIGVGANYGGSRFAALSQFKEGEDNGGKGLVAPARPATAANSSGTKVVEKNPKMAGFLQRPTYFLQSSLLQLGLQGIRIRISLF